LNAGFKEADYMFWFCTIEQNMYLDIDTYALLVRSNMLYQRAELYIEALQNLGNIRKAT